MKLRPILFSLLLAFVSFVSCTNKSVKNEKTIDTPESGEISISVDASFKPLIEEELNTFHLTYPDARIHTHYQPEQDVISDFTGKKVPLVIIPREMSADEQSIFQQAQIPFQQIKIGTDALAFVVNKSNQDSLFLYSQIVDILTGKISRWNEISSNASADSILIVFDNRRSSTIRYLENDVMNGGKLSSRAYAVDSESMVINYVEQNPRAIGVIDVSRISETDDDSSQLFLQRIRVASVSQKDSLNHPEFFLPTRYNMLYGKYPFLRNLYILLSEGHMGLGTGFANYVMSEQGQLIIHHFGLVAAKQPLRVIELKNQF